MRRLDPGDITRKLAQIDRSARSRRWKRRARAKLLRDVGARPVPGTDHLITDTGRVCAKRRFPTFSTAYQALIDTWKSPNPRRHEKRVHPCHHCKGWHLTSKLYEDPHNDHEENDRRAEANYKAWHAARESEGGRDGDPSR